MRLIRTSQGFADHQQFGPENERGFEMNAIPSQRLDKQNAHHRLFAELNGTLTQLKESGILDEDDALLTSSFIEGETFLPELIDAVLLSIDEDILLVAGIDSRLDELEARKRKLQDRIKTLRGLIEQVLVKTEIPKLETRLATVSIKNTPRGLGDVDEARLPAKYFKAADPKLDKKALLDDLKAGLQVEGATLNNGGITLAIRR